MHEVAIGKISDYFSRVTVAGIDLTAPLKKGEHIHIKGHTTDLDMTVNSIQIDHADVPEARQGDSIGIKVGDRVRHGDTVFKVTD